MNAIVNAIGPRAADLQMPATPEKVWRLCREAFGARIVPWRLDRHVSC